MKKTLINISACKYVYVLIYGSIHRHACLTNNGYCVQSTASQQEEALKHLNTKVATFEQQLSHATAIKVTAEKERNTAVFNGAQTKVYK